MSTYTLTESKTFMEEGKSTVIVDELRKTTPLFDLMVWTSNGVLMAGKWIYAWYRRTSQRSAAIRALGSEYTPDKVDAPEKQTVELSVLGGSYQVDRAVKDAGDIASIMTENELALITAAKCKLCYLIIHGDTANTGEFDGLDVTLAGTTTEYGATEYIDLSSMAAIETNWKAWRYHMNRFLAKLQRKPDVLLVNEDFLPVFIAMAQLAGAYTQTVTDLGVTVDRYNGIPFISAGERDGEATKIMATETRTIDGASVTGLTDIYAVCFGPQEVHGVTPSGSAPPIQAFPPDFTTPGAVKTGEVEIIATIAVESTRCAGVFRNLKIEE
jgi:hypothetical protein